MFRLTVFKEGKPLADRRGENAGNIGKSWRLDKVGGDSDD